MSVRDFHGILSSTRWVDPIDETKSVLLDLTTVDTGTTRTYSVPNSDTSLVGTDISQTLTNKTLTGTTNDIAANKLRVTGGNTIDFSSASVPSAGQVMRATGAGTAAWESSEGIDNVFGTHYHIDNVDLEQSTNSTTFIVAASFTTDTLHAGNYKINISFDWKYSTEVASRFGYTQLKRDATILFDNNYNIVKNRWFNHNSFIMDTVTSGIHTYEFNYRVNNRGDVFSLKHIEMELYRID